MKNMNNYVTGTAIRQLREKRGYTQAELARKLCVTAKAVSKWETARGLPDITLLEPLAQALGVSVMELMQGKKIVNRNVSANLRRTRFYVCPICGNVLSGTGEAMVSCCGTVLPPLEPENAGEDHEIRLERVEDEYFITVDHPMSREHYLSFAAYLTDDRLQLVKFYPEGEAQTRMTMAGAGMVYVCCNRHGLFCRRVP